MINISYSALRRYNSCRRKVYYRREDYPKSTTASMITGRLTHEAIELYEETSHMPNLIQKYRKELVNALDNEEVEFYKWQTVPSFLELLNTCFENYKAISKRLPPVTQSEQEFSIEYSDIVDVRGMFDQVRESNVILEFKTSKRKPSTDYLKGDLQSLVYTWAYDQLYSTLPTYYYVHLPSGSVYEVKKRDFSSLDSQIKDYVYDYTHEIFTRQGDGRKCDWCDYKESCLSDAEESNFVFEATSTGEEQRESRGSVDFSAF